MKKTKKGFIYMMTVMIFLIIILSLFYAYEVYKPSEKDDSIESRIRSMNDFIEDLSLDTERAAYIAGFRSLIALEEYVSTTGMFLSSMEDSFIEIFFNGTIGNFSPEIMNESTFSLYMSRVNQKSQEIDVAMNFSINSIDFSQVDPWTVRVDIYSLIQILDDRNLASWNFTEVFSSDISILSFKDPLYSVNTLGRLHSFVVETNISEYVINNDTTNLLDHIETGYYVASTKAPSFVMRFEGNLSADSNGIESLVDIGFLQDQDDIVIDSTRSVVDYIYFGNQTTNNKCSVQNMPSWFRIDENHINDYEINELSYVNCTT